MKTMDTVTEICFRPHEVALVIQLKINTRDNKSFSTPDTPGYNSTH